MVEMRQYIKRI